MNIKKIQTEILKQMIDKRGLWMKSTISDDIVLYTHDGVVGYIFVKDEILIKEDAGGIGTFNFPKDMLEKTGEDRLLEPTSDAMYTSGLLVKPKVARKYADKEGKFTYFCPDLLKCFTYPILYGQGGTYNRVLVYEKNRNGDEVLAGLVMPVRFDKKVKNE